MILFKQSVPKMFNMFYIWNISNKFRRLDFCIERHFIRQGACQGLVPIGFNWLCCKHIQHPHSEECKREHVSYFPLSCSVLPQIHKRQGLGLLWFLYTYIYNNNNKTTLSVAYVIYPSTLLKIAVRFGCFCTKVIAMKTVLIGCISQVTVGNIQKVGNAFKKWEKITFLCI